MAEANLIAELMEKFDAARLQWTEVSGSDEGFNAWFTAQVMTKKPLIWCETCGIDSEENECPKCQQWWIDNPLPEEVEAPQ